MTPIRKTAHRLLCRFRSDETGTLMAEAVLVLPFMLWAYLALFVYWDSFRAVNTVQKAAYTISDMLSRETLTVNDRYMSGLDGVMEYMIDQSQDAKLRVTSIRWSELNKRYEVHWSRSPGFTLTPHTTTSLTTIKKFLPKMSDGDFIVLVEVEVDYESSFNVGLNDTKLSQFIATRPRFALCVQFNSGGCPLS